MKKLISVVLLICLSFSVCPVLARDTTEVTPKTYGVDNLNNEKGNLYVAFLGGSITRGDGSSGTITYKDNAGTGSAKWASQVTKRYFQKKYPNKNVIEVNAGISGTDSNFGLFRMKNHLIDKCGSEGPDVVFIEFAVNDMWTSTSNPKDVHRRMEGIVRQLASLPKQPVIIFVYTAAWRSGSGFEWYQTSGKVHQQVADYYNIGSINLCDYVIGGTDIHGDPIVWDATNPESWTGDNTHPNNKGYTAYADYILKQFEEHPEQYLKKLTWKNVPMGNYEFGSPQLVSPINNSNVTTTGTWNMDKNISFWFEQGALKTVQGGATMTFKFTGRSIGIFSIISSLAANADYVIDQGSAHPVSGQLKPYDAAVSGMRPAPILARNDLFMGEHVIKITTQSPANTTNVGFVVGNFMIDPEQPDPIAYDVTLNHKDSVRCGTVLKGNYSYINQEKEEGKTTTQWMVCDSKDGVYTPIDGASGTSYTPGLDMVGKYMKYRVTPKDLLGNTGKSVDSEPILIGVPPADECFNTTEIAYFKEGEDTVAKTYLTNKLTGGTLKATLIMAEYEVEEDGTKKLLQTKKVTHEVAAGKTVNFSAKMNISDSLDHLVKTMVWAEPGMEPILPATQIIGGNIDKVTYIDRIEDEEETSVFVYRVNALK